MPRDPNAVSVAGQGQALVVGFHEQPAKQIHAKAGRQRTPHRQVIAELIEYPAHLAVKILRFAIGRVNGPSSGPTSSLGGGSQDHVALLPGAGRRAPKKLCDLLWVEVVSEYEESCG